MQPLKTLGQIAFEAFWERWNKEYPKISVAWADADDLCKEDWETCAKAIIEEAGRRIENQIKKGRY